VKDKPMSKSLTDDFSTATNWLLSTFTIGGGLLKWDTNGSVNAIASHAINMVNSDFTISWTHHATAGQYRGGAAVGLSPTLERVSNYGVKPPGGGSNNVSAVIRELGGTVGYISLKINSVVTNSASINLTINTIYHITFTKSGTTLTLNIYSDAARTTHVAGSPKTLTDNSTFDYTYLIVNNVGDNAADNTVTANLYDLTLTQLQPTVPEITPSYSTIDKVTSRVSIDSSNNIIFAASKNLHKLDSNFNDISPFPIPHIIDLKMQSNSCICKRAHLCMHLHPLVAIHHR